MSLIDLLILVIILCWLGGLGLHLGGALVNLLLLIVVVLVLARILQR